MTCVAIVLGVCRPTQHTAMQLLSLVERAGQPVPSLPPLAGKMVPQLQGHGTNGGGGGGIVIQLPPSSYGFVRFPGAGIAACR